MACPETGIIIMQGFVINGVIIKVSEGYIVNMQFAVIYGML